MSDNPWSSYPLGTAQRHTADTHHETITVMNEPGWRCKECIEKSPAWYLPKLTMSMARGASVFIGYGPNEPQRPDWDDYFLAIAKTVARRADCTRRKVGAVVVDVDRRIVGTGYNGGPSGGKSCLAGECPRGTMSKTEVKPGSSYDTGAGACIALHAEQNAIAYSDYSKRKGGSIYITCEPCDGCWRELSGSGIRYVYWSTDDSGLPGRYFMKDFKGY